MLPPVTGAACPLGTELTLYSVRAGLGGTAAIVPGGGSVRSSCFLFWREVCRCRPRVADAPAMAPIPPATAAATAVWFEGGVEGREPGSSACEPKGFAAFWEELVFGRSHGLPGERGSLRIAPAATGA